MEPYLTLALIVIGGIFIGQLCKRSSSKALLPHSQERGSSGAKPYAINTVKTQDDVSNTQPDPLNYTSNIPHLNKLQTEIGPYGVPRNIYQGPGGSRIVTYGSNYEAL